MRCTYPWCCHAYRDPYSKVYLENKNDWNFYRNRFYIFSFYLKTKSTIWTKNSNNVCKPKACKPFNFLILTMNIEKELKRFTFEFRFLSIEKRKENGFRVLWNDFYGVYSKYWTVAFLMATTNKILSLKFIYIKLYICTPRFVYRYTSILECSIEVYVYCKWLHEA